jgi:TonB family protein
VIWLAGFTLVFILFLRNERFFLLNRMYLVAGILTSLFFPLISVHYTVVLPVIRNFQTESAVTSEIQNAGSSIIPDLKLMLLVLYFSGVLFVLTQIIRQGRSLHRTIKKSEIISVRPIKLIKTPDYTYAFSFFSYVFVNPSITDIETKEIMNHELVHIRQKHWFDLLLVELLCMINSFNYSLNKKRFNMMKNIINSPYRKMKILLILPVFAIVLYAFAKPDYRYKDVDENSGNYNPGISLEQKSVKGTVVQQDGKPLQGATITVKGTTLGSFADAKGNFKLDNVPDDGLLVVSFVGFKSRVLKPVFTSEMTINMVRDTVVIADGHPPLYVVDGITVTQTEAEKIDPNSIESVSVLKDKSAIEKPATDKYGEKGKDGVVEITTKKKTAKDAFVVVEEMPEFPGGREAMVAWIAANLKYPAEAVKSKITGKVYINFVVSSTGKVKNVVVSKSASPLLNDEAVRVISSMPDWKPGSQAGKPVEVQMLVPVEFKLK